MLTDFTNGKRNGLHKSYFPNDQVELKLNFDDDTLYGLYRRCMKMDN